MIVDTNALSAAAEHEPAAMQAVAGADRLLIPVIVLGEYLFGIAHSRRHKDYERWLAGFVADSAVVEIDADTARHYAQIRTELKVAGRPIPSNDVWIAALCRQHASTLISRDQHFDSVQGIKRIAW